jgi:uncharacterized membrane protein YphA (DoxX/SURF4 family)
MTIITLLVSFAIAAAVLLGLTWQKVPNRFISFLQYFTGVWFTFSGIVKALDPIGTALKMQDYFEAFDGTAECSGQIWLLPIFSYLSEQAVGVAIFVVVLEIILGIALIIGIMPRTTAWIFLLLNVFFTILTGYTHLTGFVPDGVCFFEFSKWGEFVKSNMKVTDCGCFGDFLKLDPSVSFKKDFYLLTPISLIFVFLSGRFHQLFASNTRRNIIIASIVASLALCAYNTFSNEPIVDFRPFQNGVNIREQKAAEVKAAGEVKILNWQLKNEKTGESLTVDDKTYMANYETKYTEENGWKVLDNEKTDPSVKRTKISDFMVFTPQDEDITQQLLNEKGYTFLVLSGKVKSMSTKKVIEVADSIYRTDTIKQRIEGRDSFTTAKVFERVGKKEEVFRSYSFDADYRDNFSKKINPVVEAAEKAGHKIAAILPTNDARIIEDFRHAAQTAYPFYYADEKLIKTMMRSNPGLLLLKDGQIVHKWHINQMPTFEDIKAAYMK